MSLVDKEFITSSLTADDPWCSSHGSGEGSERLGAGMLYYSIAYALEARTCVCLGSGGGFVPRLMRQAQRDLNLEASRTFLVDGAHLVSEERKNIWGTPAWLAPDSTFRKNYPDVEILQQLTKDAIADYFAPKKINIEFLHIDADHHYDGVKADWELYRSLVSDKGVITFHDTVNHREPCGVPRLIEEIRREGEYAVVNFPVSYGTAIVSKNPTSR